MARFEEMTIGARRVRGPISDLVDLSRNGVPHVAVAFHDDFRDDDALGAGLEPLRGFLELPMADGIAPLVTSRRGVFAYRAPAGRTVRELISVFAEEGGGGSRAALELVADAMAALRDAARSGLDHGVRNHGALDPWRILVDDEGKVCILGYGLPPLDVLDFQRDEQQIPTVDTLRYCPPERIDGEAEDWTSDLFAVALMAAELATGKPVYPGKGRELVDRVSAGEAQKLLGDVPRELVAVIRTALAPQIDQRPTDPQTVIEAARKAESRTPGRTLAELVGAARQYLADVEDDIPPGFTVLDLVGPPPDEPQRLAAVQRAAAAAGRAGALLDAMIVFLDGERARFDAGLDGVSALVTRAEQAIDAARVAAGNAERASDQAAAAMDAQAALTAAGVAEAASDAAGDAQRELQRSVEEAHRIRSDAERVAENKRAAAAAVAQAIDARADAALASAPPGSDEVEEQVGLAKAAARKATVAHDPAAAQRAVERALAAVEAAERAAEAAIQAARVVAERVARANRAVSRAEAALASIPDPEVRAALSEAVAAASDAGNDPMAPTRAEAAAQNAETAAQAAAARRELVRRRAWVAVARADATGRGDAARKAAEEAEDAVDPDEVLAAAVRAEAAADRAEAEAKDAARRIDAARARITAAQAAVDQATATWHPSGLADERATVQQATVVAAGTDLDAVVAAADRAEAAAARAFERSTTAAAALEPSRRRVTDALDRAMAAFASLGRPDDAESLIELARTAAALAAEGWDPEEVAQHAAAAEQALAELQGLVAAHAELVRERERAEAAAAAAAREAEDLGEPDAAEHAGAARAAADLAGEATDLAEARSAADRADAALARVRAVAGARAERLAVVRGHRERAEDALRRAVSMAIAADAERLDAVRAAVDEANGARDPDEAGAAADRASRAADVIAVAAQERTDRQLKIAALRDGARRAVHTAVDHLDRIDAEDVRHVEAARAALNELERATDVGLAAAALERALQASVAVQDAAARRTARETELARINASASALEARARSLLANNGDAAWWDTPPDPIASAVAGVRASASAATTARDVSAARSAEAALALAVDTLGEAVAAWKERLARALDEGRERARAAADRLRGLGADRPDLAPVVERATALASKARSTTDAANAQALAAEVEALAANAFKGLERARALEVARERLAEAAARIEALADAPTDLSRFADGVHRALALATGDDADPDAARAAADEAEGLAAAAATAAADAADRRVRAREKAAAAAARAQATIDRHPSMLDDPNPAIARTAHADAQRAQDADEAALAAERAAAAAEASEAALAAALEVDRQAVLAVHRDRAAALRDQAAAAAEAAPYANVGDLVAELRAAVGELAGIDDPADAGARAARAEGIAQAVERTVIEAARARARAALGEAEQAAARVESAELELHVEATRMAVAEADGAARASDACAAADAAVACAADAGRALIAALEAERGGRISLARARADRAVASLEAAGVAWALPDDVDHGRRLAVVRRLAGEARTATDLAQVHELVELAERRSAEGLDSLRSIGAAPAIGRAEAAVARARAAIGRVRTNLEIDQALAQVLAARAEVDEATSSAGAVASAARVEWLLPAVFDAVGRVRLGAVRARVAELTAELAGIGSGDPEVDARLGAARDATAAAEAATEPDAADAALASAEAAAKAAREAWDERRGTPLAPQRAAPPVRPPAAKATGPVEAAGARAEAARIDAEVAAEREAARRHTAARAAAAVASATRAASAAAPLPEGAPPELAEVHAAIGRAEAAVRRLAAEVQGVDAARDNELADEAHAWVSGVDAAVARYAEALANHAASTARAARDRARAAVVRAHAAATAASAIRADLSIGRAVRQAERALAATEAAAEPGEADWSAAMAVTAADKAEELLQRLEEDVGRARALIEPVRTLHADATVALDRMNAPRSPTDTRSATLGPPLRAAWERAETAAAAGLVGKTEEACAEVRAAANAVLDAVRAATATASRLDRIRGSRTAGPTLMPGDFEALEAHNDAANDPATPPTAPPRARSPFDDDDPPTERVLAHTSPYDVRGVDDVEADAVTEHIQVGPPEHAQTPPTAPARAVPAPDAVDHDQPTERIEDVVARARDDRSPARDDDSEDSDDSEDGDGDLQKTALMSLDRLRELARARRDGPAPAPAAPAPAPPETVAETEDDDDDETVGGARPLARAEDPADDDTQQTVLFVRRPPRER